MEQFTTRVLHSREHGWHRTTADPSGCATPHPHHGTGSTAPMLITSAIYACTASIGLALSRRHGVVKINTAMIQMPLLRQGTDVFLSVGDYAVGFAERNGVDVAKITGAGDKDRK